MFTLAVIKDTVCIEPKYFGQPYHDSILQQLDKKYANRVLVHVGLCLRTFDLLAVEEPFIRPGEGSIVVKVQFRMVVFRPFRGEILSAKIRACTHEGVHASLGFFSDILIPASMLPETSEFNQEEQVWVWKCEEGDIYMDLEEEIKIRVLKESFVETNPKKQNAETAGANSEMKPAYSLICSMNEPGLGCPVWWAGSE